LAGKISSKKPTFFVILAIVAALAYVAVNGFFWLTDFFIVDIKGANEMRLGIDINGGVDAVFECADKSITPTKDQLDAAKSKIEARLDARNILDRDVAVSYEDKIVLVRFPWKSGQSDTDSSAALKELGEMAHLTFKDPDGNIVIEGKHVVKATPGYSAETSYSVELKLNSEGGKLFADATKRLQDKNISIYMDDTLISSPVVRSHITGGTAYITDISSSAEANDLAAKINAGALPFALSVKSNSTINATLGKGALDIMVKAGIVAFAAVCLFMLLYYRLPGFVAVIALTLQVACQLLALSVPQFSLTLPGIAGIILSIGMGVDANVIISERIKEEIRSGKTIDGAIQAGFKKAFSSVFDGNITVMIVAIILMIFGSGVMLSFGYSLLTGVLLNFLCGVTASRLMIRSLSSQQWLRKKWFFGAGREASK